MKEYTYNINGNDYKVEVEGIENDEASVIVNGEKYTVKMPEQPKPEQPKVVKPVVAQPAPAAAPAAENVDAANSANKSSIKAPLPGVIVDITVAVGDAVKKGQTIGHLEAMKMNNDITSDRNGTVAQICVKAGESVMEDAPLVILA
jgi:biotin carboxyl carrier protein